MMIQAGIESRSECEWSETEVTMRRQIVCRTLLSSLLSPLSWLTITGHYSHSPLALYKVEHLAKCKVQWAVLLCGNFSVCQCWLVAVSVWGVGGLTVTQSLLSPQFTHKPVRQHLWARQARTDWPPHLLRSSCISKTVTQLQSYRVTPNNTLALHCLSSRVYQLCVENKCQKKKIFHF